LSSRLAHCHQRLARRRCHPPGFDIERHPLLPTTGFLLPFGRRLRQPIYNRRVAWFFQPAVCALGAPTVPHRRSRLHHCRWCFLVLIQSLDLDVISSSMEDVLVIWLLNTPSAPTYKHSKGSNSTNNRERKWHLYRSLYPTHQLSIHPPTPFNFVISLEMLIFWQKIWTLGMQIKEQREYIKFTVVKKTPGSTSTLS
jgi:hypothetical protein